MDVFDLHQHVVDDYASYTKSFIRISDERIAETVQREISEGLLWPEPLLQLNPSFAPGKKIDELVSEGVLHDDCGRIFRIKKNENDFGRDLRLYLHQEKAIRLAKANQSYVLTTGTGSGKSLAYIIPAVDSGCMVVMVALPSGLRGRCARQVGAATARGARHPFLGAHARPVY